MTTVDRAPRHAAASVTATRATIPGPMAVRAARNGGGRRHRRAAGFRRWLAARPSSAAVLRKDLTSFLTANGIDDAATRQIVLCADEALINAVAHGAGSPVAVSADLRDQYVTLDVSDGGPGLEPSRIEGAVQPDLMAEHGRGLFLIRTLMDDLAVLSDGHGTTLRMVRAVP